jgi:hypothetical protein
MELTGIAGRLVGVRVGMRQLCEDFASMLIEEGHRKEADRLAWLSAVLEDCIEEQAERLGELRDKLITASRPAVVA